jgi:hypothetical protein
MTETKTFTIGSAVWCRDGSAGELRRVVVDPIARVLTHLVVEPVRQPGSGRLVPIDLVDIDAAGTRLRCGTAEFDVLETAEQTPSCTGTPYHLSGDGQEQRLLWPYYGLAEPAAASLGMPFGPPPTTYDRIPRGDVELRRGEQVHASDGAIGRVQGLTIDRDRHVTHVVLEAGHLWSHRRVAIPIQAVTTVEGGVQIDLTKHDVRDLPAVGR